MSKYSELFAVSNNQPNGSIHTPYTNDDSFGPFLKLPSEAAFDFTLLFEETILSIGPSALLLILTPPRIIRLWKSPRKVIRSHFLTTKLVGRFAIILFIFKLTVCRSYLPWSTLFRSSMSSKFLSHYFKLVRLYLPLHSLCWLRWCYLPYHILSIVETYDQAPSLRLTCLLQCHSMLCSCEVDGYAEITSSATLWHQLYWDWSS